MPGTGAEAEALRCGLSADEAAIAAVCIDMCADSHSAMCIDVVVDRY